MKNIRKKSIVRNTKKKSVKEKGITLVALVITIIILLILAGVTIGTALRTKWTISKSKNSRREI